MIKEDSRIGHIVETVGDPGFGWGAQFSNGKDVCLIL